MSETNAYKVVTWGGRICYVGGYKDACEVLRNEIECLQGWGAVLVEKNGNLAKLNLDGRECVIEVQPC